MTVVHGGGRESGERCLLRPTLRWSVKVGDRRPPPRPLPALPSSVLLPLSNSLTLCHSNLVAALSHVVATSFQLLTQPTHPALQPSPLAFIPAPQSVPAASFTSPSAPRSISIPPRFTIRVVTDLEPVTPPASQPSSPSSPIAPPASLPIPLIPSRRTSTAQPDAFSAEQSDVVVKATLHQVRAAATSPVSTAQQTADQNDNDCPSPDAAPTATPPPAASDHLPSPASPPTPPTSVIHVPTADAAVSVDESDVTVKAIPHPVSAAVISSPADSTQSASSDKDRDKDNKRSTPHTTCRPATRSTDTPIHPFFIDLTNRTGKATKHFRRLYPPTSTICECGLFPAFAAQRPSSAPAHALPEPFQRLCLACLEELFRSCADMSVEYRCNDVYLRVVAPHFWDDTWHGTLDTHYNKYYTPQQLAAFQETDSRPVAEVEYNRAFEWVQHSLQDQLHRRGRNFTREWD